MRTDLNKLIEEDDLDSRILAMECYNFSKMIDQQLAILNPSLPEDSSLERRWNLGLESQDDGANERRKPLLEKMLNFIVKMLKKIYDAFVKFYKFINASQEQKNAKEAEEILKKKENKNIDFVNDIIKQLSSTQLSVISAIEENDNFVTMYTKNIDNDQKIVAPHSSRDMHNFEKNIPLVEDMDQNIAVLNELISEASAKEAEERDRAFRKTLSSGFSINGSENNAYLKSFTKNDESEKKFEKLLKVVEELKESGASEDQVISLRKVAITLSQQFTLEAKVVSTYLKLNKSVIEVNNKIYAEYNKWALI